MVFCFCGLIEGLRIRAKLCECICECLLFVSFLYERLDLLFIVRVVPDDLLGCDVGVVRHGLRTGQSIPRVCVFTR